MKKLMPQEIEVWYLIPALRRELTMLLISEYGLKQKQTAEILGITDAAISQYLNSKRAKEVKFTKDEIDKIKRVAEQIVRNPGFLMEGLYSLCIAFRGSKTVCDLHRIKDKTVDCDCDICLEKH